MITTRVNGIDYEVILVEAGHEKLKIKRIERCGTTWFHTGKIYILNTLPYGVMRQVLMHELTHAYMMAYGFLPHDKFDDEELCDFMAAYADPISKDADAVLRHCNIRSATETN